MSHSVKRAKSQFEQFRMAVPPDIRALVGKSEWTASLGTTDPVLAAAKRAELVAFYKTEVLRFRGLLARKPVDDALRLLDRGFERLAVIRGSMDKAIADQLSLVASTVIDSWEPGGQLGDINSVGDLDFREPTPDRAAIPSIDNEADREIFRVRASLLENTGNADGILYRKLAALLLEKRIHRPIWYAVSYMQSIEPKLKLKPDNVYEAVAEAYLKRLAEHQFTSWKPGAEAAVTPILTLTPTTDALMPPVMIPAEMRTGLWTMTLTEGLAYWKRQRRPSKSAIEAVAKTVRNFIHLFGDRPIGEITRPDMIRYRDLLYDLPPQTTLSKVLARGQTLETVIAEAREKWREWEEGKRVGDEPDRLAPGSIKKDVDAISWILGKVKADAGCGINVAENIEIAGYSKTKKGQKRPRLSFTPQMMQSLFDSPLYTGCAGRGVAQRAKPGPHIYQDELYWSFLFGVVGGPRLGEIGQIAVSDVHEVDLRRTYNGKVEGRCTFINITGTGKDQHVKSAESERWLALHDRLVELGFNDYVAERRAAGEKYLFDFKPGGRDSFIKELSRRCNRYLDRAISPDPRYVFYSSRHEFTDRAELSRMPARVANSIKGQANLTVADNYGLVTLLSQYVHLQELDVSFVDWDRLRKAAQASKLLAGQRVQLNVAID